MANLFSQKAKFEEVVKNDEALQFHYLNFENGQRYTLARLCYQYIQGKK
jgi:hypothetical protein